MGWATMRGIGPGFQFATPQKQAAAELQYFHGAYSVISAHYRVAAGYEFAREAAYLRGGFGVGFLFAMLNTELAQALKTDSFGTVFVPSLTIMRPCELGHVSIDESAIVSDRVSDEDDSFVVAEVFFRESQEVFFDLRERFSRRNGGSQT
jgi:hypothetical protein